MPARDTARSDADAPSARGPGRPAGESADGVRQSLIEAARALCIETGLDAATTKSIAQRAGVNPAMINYYFGSKEGLGREMMLASIAPVLEQIEAASVSAGAEGISLARFVEGYMRALSRNPWIPQLVIREVLPANGRFRELFLSELASRAGRLLKGLVGRDGSTGQLDPAIDAELVPVSVISVAVFPFLAAPVLEHVLGVRPFDDEVAERLIEHSVAVLERAVGAGASA